MAPLPLVLAELAKHDRSVVAAEPKAVRHGDGEFLFACFVGGVVQVTHRIGSLVVDCRRNSAVLDRFDADNRFDAPAGTEEMSKMALGARDAYLIGMVTENFLNSRGFRLVAQGFERNLPPQDRRSQSSQWESSPWLVGRRE